MKKIQISMILSIILLSILSGCRSVPEMQAFQTSESPDINGTPKNIILFIGDGMGPVHIDYNSARLLDGEGSFSFEQFPVTTYMTTHNVVGGITDSAAAATAMATGQKTVNWVIGVSPEGEARRNLIEAVSDKGMMSGLITTSSLADATPAGFSVHSSNRQNKAHISRTMVSSGVNLLLGGGLEHFSLIEEGEPSALDAAREEGFNIVYEAQDLKEASLPLLGLFGDDEMYKARDITLADMTETALDLLSAGDEGFFLMVEEERTDHGSHDMKMRQVSTGVAALEEAVRSALRFAETNPDTLIIVTADHETGGLRLTKSKLFPYVWSTYKHTNTTVDLYAWGKGAALFDEAMDNTKIVPKIAALLELSGMPEEDR